MGQTQTGPGTWICNGWHMKLPEGAVSYYPDEAELIPITEAEYELYQSGVDDEDATVELSPGDRTETGPYSNCRSNYMTPETAPHMFTDGTDQTVHSWAEGINIQTGGLYTVPDDPEQIIWLSNRNVCYVSQANWKPGLPGLESLWVKLVVPGAPWNYPTNYIVGDTMTYEGSNGPDTMWQCDRPLLTQSNWYPGAPGMETYYSEVV